MLYVPKDKWMSKLFSYQAMQITYDPVSGKEIWTSISRKQLLHLACIIFSVFASSPPAVDPDAAAASMVWSYIGELTFNMLILVGSVKMSDHVVREMMGL